LAFVNQDEGVEQQNFAYVLGGMYRRVFGENIDIEVSLITWAIYLSFTLVVNITTLNLLISIISTEMEAILND